MTKSSIFGDKDIQPSYGMVGFYRSHHNPHPVFGSSIKHSDTIDLVIGQGSVTRELNQDWYSKEHDIVRVTMSYSQFVEAITNMNMGNGIPCTIRYTKEKGFIEHPDFEDKSKILKDEFLKKCKDQLTELEEGKEVLNELLEKKSLNKADRKQIADLIDNVLRLYKNQLPFIQSQFQQQMNQTLLEAKGEIEAFAQNKMHSLMAKHLQELDTESPVVLDMPLLENTDTDET